MCGICGFVTQKGTDFEDCIQSMNRRLAHRGPDSEGYWLDNAAGCALGHRRLSIIDLSEHGSQPMVSASGRYVVTYNGEIYNYRQVLAQLEAESPLTLRGHSDTEVMLAAFERWGVPKTLEAMVGMFALALWDRQEHRLTLCRDRLGEKPLYYGWMGSSFLFASELKALKPHSDWHGVVNRDALAAFLRYNYIPSPLSIYEGIYKLPPGTWLTINDWQPGQLPQPVPYWSVEAHFWAGMDSPLQCTDQEAVEQLDQLLRQAVSQQMIADVPLGAFLSGGIDSSTIVALMQAQSSQPIKTFSIGFDDPDFNEAPYAREVARHLGTDHTEQYVTGQDALNVIPLLPTLYDEPFSDVSQIPTYLVSRLARQHVTVSLSGDAGDELFHGYQRYFDAIYTYQTLKKIPAPLHSGLRAIINTVPTSGWKMLMRSLRPWLPDSFRQHDSVDKLRRLAEMLPLRDAETFYLAVMSHWQQPETFVHQARSSIVKQPNFRERDEWGSLFAGFDLQSYLPDDILVKVDRASMAVALESRVPLLDHRLVEFVLRLPPIMKFREGTPKWLLRQVLYRYVPPALIERPKMGFGVPLGHWLRHDLRDWAESLLDPTRLRNEGFFEPALIRKCWAAHIDQTENRHYHLWDVLMFQSWLEQEKIS